MEPSLSKITANHEYHSILGDIFNAIATGISKRRRRERARNNVGICPKPVLPSSESVALARLNHVVSCMHWRSEIRIVRQWHIKILYHTEVI